MNDMTITPDGLFYVGAGKDGTIRIWTVNKNMTSNLPFDGCERNGAGLAFSPSGTLLATACNLPDANEEIAIWSTDTWEIDSVIDDNSDYIVHPSSLHFQSESSLITTWNWMSELVTLI